MYAPRVEVSSLRDTHYYIVINFIFIKQANILLYYNYLYIQDLICCDGCTKVYHSACHKPMIAALPEGDWYCMICCETKKVSNNNQKKSIYSGPLVANLGHCEVVCKVRFPKIECIVCEEMEGKSSSRNVNATTF